MEIILFENRQQQVSFIVPDTAASQLRYVTRLHFICTMDFESRSSALIIDRLVEGKSWPESSRSFWIHAEVKNVSYFNRHALCTGFWSPGPCRYKTIEFWNDVAGSLVEKWMDRFRLIILQADELSWAGFGNYAGWEQQWLKTMMEGVLVDL